MSKLDLRPTTLDGIKRLATRLKKADGIPHHEALDRVARQAGYENFAHASNALSGALAVAPRSKRPHDVFLTAYWHAADGTAGRVTLQTALDRPARSVAWRGASAGPYQLEHFRVTADDHIEATRELTSAEVARLVVAEACRALHFLDATDLCARTSRLRRVPALPHWDHIYELVHRGTGAWIVIDEPYVGDWLLEERRAWGADKGLHFDATPYRLYDRQAPDGDERMFFATFDADALGSIMSGIEQRSNELDPTRRLTFDTGPRTPAFRSPAQRDRKTRQRAAAAPIDPTKPRRNSLPYRYGDFVEGIFWRPAAEMPLSAHEECGELMAALRNLAYSTGRLVTINSTLDCWMGCERDLCSPWGDNTGPYRYRSSASLAAGMTVDAAFARIRHLLDSHYPECKPLRDMRKRLDVAQRQLARQLARQNAA